MSGFSPLLAWVIGLFLLFVGERFYGEGAALRMPVSGLGVLLMVVAAGLRARLYSSAGGETRKVLGRLLPAYVVGLLGVGLYFLRSSDVEAVASEGSQDVLGVLWPILLLAGSLPVFAMEKALRSMAGAKRLEVRRLFDAGHAGLAIALATSWLFALNWVAAEKDERIDLRTVRNLLPSGMTTEMVRNLDEDVTITLFFPPANDVYDLIEPYFTDLAAASPRLTVERKDRDSHPALAKEMRARKNGVVVLSKGDDHEQVRLDTDPKKARSKLKKLDEDVQKKLGKVARDQRVAYLVLGHGERSTAPKADDPPGLKGAKELLKQLNYKVKNLGLKEGLSEDVPDDATLVIVPGPRSPMLPQEMEALVRYVQRGGSLMLLADPDVEESPQLEPLLDVLGLELGSTTLAHEGKYVALTRGLSDRSILYSNRITAHDSTTLLSKLTTKGNIVFPVTGSLAQKEGLEGGPQVTFTVRSLAGTFADSNDNRAFDPGEEKAVFNLAAAVELPAPDGAERGGRAVVTADADVISDLLFGRVPMNQNFFGESVLWLEGEVLMAGEVADIEDTPIVHTKDTNKRWFYGTTLGVPLLLLGAGFGVTRRRRKR